MSVEGGTPAAMQDQAFEDTPKGWSQRWRMEFDAARKEHKDWKDKGNTIVERFLDKRDGRNMPTGIDTRWNLYTSSIQTKRAMLYGKPPTVDVRPKFSDAPDSVARLAGEIGERLLNSDIERDEDGFKDALENCLMDRLNPGAAFLKFAYIADYEEVEGKEAMLAEDGSELAPAVPASQKKSREEVETDYVHWRDALWSPCRTFREMRWCAFRAQLKMDGPKGLKEKFGEEVAKKIALDAKKEAGGSDAAKADPWQRANLWEIWDKENKCVWFFIEGHTEVLKPVDLDDAQFNENGSLKDPLGLRNFWPFGKPMLANVTTSAFVPRADFTICQDLLDEVDRVSTRITELERAIGAKGVYDKNSEPLKRLLDEATNGKMIPVENWGALMEKGGLAGAFQLLPLEGLIAALDRLEAYRNSLVQAYYQISGDSDLSRGSQVENGTPGEAQVKAKFASVRMQALQDEFARFASDAQAVRLEIVAKHFDPQTILDRSNIAHSFDADDPQAIMEAIKLLKSDTSCYRVEVKPENVSMQDFAQVRQERTEVIGAVASFIQTAAPLAQMMPGSMPYLLKMLQWMVGGLRGASTIQGVIDQAIAHAEQMPPQQAQGGPPQPDPKLLAQQAKTQGDLQRIQAQANAEQIGRLQETEQMNIRAQNTARVDIQKEAVKAHIKAAGAAAAPMPDGQGGMS